MKSGFSPVLSIQIFALTKKLSLMNLVAAYGKLYLLKYIFYSNHWSSIFKIILIFLYSIVMEYSDNGDLFQKITSH